MRRVAYVFPWGELGGAEIATIRMLEAHDSKRYIPFAIVFADGPVIDRLRSSDVDIHLAKYRPRLRKRSERKETRRWIASILRDERAALQHDVMSWTHAIAGPAAYSAGVPVVWYQHNRPDRRSLIDWWAAWNDASVIIANSQFTAGLQRRLNFRRLPIDIIYPPMAPFDPACRRDDIREELNLSEDDIFLLLPARLQRWKGQDVAIKALAKALESTPNLHLILAGGSLFGLEPEYRIDLEALVSKLGVSNRIQFLGQRNDLPALYEACDIMLHTSRHPEPFGLVVAEAKVHGKPIIATDAGAIPEQIEHEKTGLLVPPENDLALAAALQKLAANVELRDSFGKAAAAAASASPKEACVQLERLYDRVLES